MSSAANIRRITGLLVLLLLAGTTVPAAEAGAGDTLTARVRRALLRYADPAVETVVEIRGIPAVGELPATYDVRVIVPVRFRLRGSFRCEAEIVTGGTLWRRIPIRVMARTVSDVLVSERLLDRYATVQAGDVATQRIETTDLSEPPPASMSALEGLRLRRIVPAGTVLLRSMFEPVPLVRSGSEVTILVRTGAVSVRTRGVARGDGGKGERVAVRPEGGRNEIRGVVVGHGMVEVTAE